MDRKDESIQHLLFDDAGKCSLGEGDDSRPATESQLEDSIDAVTSMAGSLPDDLELPAESKLENLSLFNMVTLPASISSPSAPSCVESVALSTSQHNILNINLSPLEQRASPGVHRTSPRINSSLQAPYSSASNSLSPSSYSPKDINSNSRAPSPAVSQTFSFSVDSSKANFLVSGSSDSETSGMSRCSSSLQHSPFSLGLSANNFLNQRSSLTSSMEKLDANFSTMDTEDVSFMMSRTNHPLMSSFGAPKMSPTPTSASTCGDTFHNFSPSSSHSSLGSGEDFESNTMLNSVQSVASNQANKHSPSPNNLSEPSPPQYRGESVTAQHSDSSCSSRNSRNSKHSRKQSGRINEDNANKSDSGIGDTSSSASESQCSPPNYASLTPWTNKLSSPDYVPVAAPSRDNWPIPIDIVTQKSMLAISPGSLDTPVHLTNSQYFRNFSRIHSHKSSSVKEENANKKSSSGSHHKASLKVPNKDYRFKRTAEALQKSGLWEVAMKTGNLMKRNRELQKELDQFRLDALTFLKSVIKNPQNRDFIKNVLNNALSQNAPRKSKQSVMSVVVSAAAAAVKMEAPSASESSPFPSPSVPTSGELPDDLLENNFLGVKTSTTSLTMDFE